MNRHPRTHVARTLALAVVAAVLLTTACSKDPEISAGPQPPPSQDGANPTPPPTDSDGNVTTTPTLPPVDVYPGMPAVVDPSNIYSEIDQPNPATQGSLFRVYVPNEASGTLTVIDPSTQKVIDTFTVGMIPQHVVPSYDMKTLYVLNNSGNSIMPIDPLTGKLGKQIYVDDPYNLYFTPDGKEAIIIAEAKQRIDFADPTTFKVNTSLQTQCDGLNHIDYSIDGKFFVATCEFEGAIIKVDMATKKVVGKITLDVAATGKTNTVKKITQPQDIRISPDGKVFYIADLITSGLFVVDAQSFTFSRFLPMGVGTHSLYPSRDGKKAFVINRGTETIPPVGSFKGKGKGSVMVMDFATEKIEATWDIPNGGSPDMGNLTADGKQLWLGGRYDREVYVFDTVEGKLINRIEAGQNPHGLTVWPQPGRVSFGHTGNLR